MGRSQLGGFSGAGEGLRSRRGGIMICRKLWFGLIILACVITPATFGNALDEITCTIKLDKFKVVVTTGAEAEKKPAWGSGKGEMTVRLENHVKSSEELNQYRAKCRISKIISGLPDPGLVQLFFSFGGETAVPGPVDTTLVGGLKFQEEKLKEAFLTTQALKDNKIKDVDLKKMTVGFVARWQCIPLAPIKGGREEQPTPGVAGKGKAVGNKGGVVIDVDFGTTSPATTEDFAATTEELDDLLPGKEK